MAKLPYSYPTLANQTTIYALTQEVNKMFQRIALAFNQPDNGDTAARPTLDLVPGQVFYDTTLAKPVWWDAVAATWRDASGTPV